MPQTVSSQSPAVASAPTPEMASFAPTPPVGGGRSGEAPKASSQGTLLGASFEGPLLSEVKSACDLPSTTVDLGRFASVAAGFLRGLHIRRKLLPLLREATVERCLLRLADEFGLAVSSEELQSAADTFRHRQGLTYSEDTRSWLKRERLTIAYLEDALRRELILAKLRDHVTCGQVARHFDADPSRYDRARVRYLASVQGEWSQDPAGTLRAAVDSIIAKLQVSAPASPQLADDDAGVVFRFQLPSAVADTIFAAAPGSMVGPVAVSHGQHFFLLETMEPSQLDEVTSETIREELFATWVAGQSGDEDIASELCCLI